MEYLIITFLVTSFLLAIAPGPSVIYTVAYTLRYGSLTGYISAIGINVGSYISIFIAAFSTSALINSFPFLLDAIRFLGSLYILYLAYKLWPKEVVEENTKILEVLSISNYEVFKNGVITSLLNPKDILFYIAFIPQFISPAPNGLSYEIQFLLFAFSYALVGLATKVIFILFSAKLRTYLQSKKSQIINYVASVLLVTLSIYIMSTVVGSMILEI